MHRADSVTSYGVEVLVKPIMALRLWHFISAVEPFSLSNDKEHFHLELLKRKGTDETNRYCSMV
jgi:hypothetical protein